MKVRARGETDSTPFANQDPPLPPSVTFDLDLVLAIKRFMCIALLFIYHLIQMIYDDWLLFWRRHHFKTQLWKTGLLLSNLRRCQQFDRNVNSSLENAFTAFSLLYLSVPIATENYKLIYESQFHIYKIQHYIWYFL